MDKGRTDRRVTVHVLAIVVPIVIAAAFEPAHRFVVPESMMFAVVVAATFLGGAGSGVVAVISSTVSLWYFNLPPYLSFRFNNAGDGFALLAACLVGIGLVVLIAVLLSHERASSSRAAVAVREAELQRETITRLQRALLPEAVPPISGLTVGWHYETGAGTTLPVGGDWLAFVPLPPDCLAVAVGDVAGHGIAAVSAMAQYRFALRTIISTTSAPQTVLHHVDESARFFDIPLFSTCLVGVLNTTDATWTYSSAGHPPPLLVRDGLVQLLAAPHGPPLGAIGQESHYDETTVRLKDGDLLALYTDGLVERRGEDLDTGIRRLGDRLLDVPMDQNLREASSAIVAELADTTVSDDIVLMVIRYTATPALN
jgi:serine phosphatase RsbU (regulator of sigma subunit)